jgi:hypothetical protein
METEKKTKVTYQMIESQMNNIREATNTIASEIASLPESSAKKSFSIILIALQKKLEQFGTPHVVLTAEEKEVVRKAKADALQKFREEKNKVSEVPADDGMSENSEENVKSKKHARRS